MEGTYDEDLHARVEHLGVLAADLLQHIYGRAGELELTATMVGKDCGERKDIVSADDFIEEGQETYRFRRLCGRHTERRPARADEEWRDQRED